jgi:hypothetical protein
MRESLVAINVICNGKIINREGIPLLFYWNGETDVLEDIKENIDFKQWLEDEEILTNMESYINSHIAFFYFKTHDEDYHDLTCNVQDLYNLDTLIEFKNDLLFECVYYLYNKSFPERNGMHLAGNTLEQCKIAIDMILEKYQDKILPETCKNAIRAYVQEHYKDFNRLDEFMDYVNEVIFN